MRVLVCGGRFYANAKKVDDVLGAYHADSGFVLLIEGGAKGADSLARAWAKEHGVPVDTYTANWNKYGRKAGPLRNQAMLDKGRPDLVIAFPGGVGTADMVRRAKAESLEVVEVD